MGNTLCGHAQPGVASCGGKVAAGIAATAAAPKQQLEQEQQLEQQQQQPPSNSHAKPPRSPTQQQKVSLTAAAAAARAAPPQAVSDEVEGALTAARAELAAASKRCFADDYTAGRIIGHGAYCKVQACTHNESGCEFAVKAVQKVADSLKQREGIIKEVAITRLLSGHPCAVQLQGVYEDATTYYLVMELCSGGELFDQIVARGHFSEQDAVGIMRALLDFVAYAHSKHIVHRDLKPENLLLTSRDRTAQLKVIDFGTSEFCSFAGGQRLHQKFGTPYYVAPEVLRKDYAHAADVWSAGVIMFILLSGYPPFPGPTDARILQRVQQGSYSFAAKEWEAVSESAKSMITAMLVHEEGQRSTAAALTKHPWLTMEPSARKVPNPAAATALGAHMVRRLRGFAKLSHLKRLALVVMAQSMSDGDVSRLRSLFMSMDKDGDGRISAQDLHRAIEQVGVSIEEHELQELFEVADISGQGLIDYEEFIAAMLDSQRVALRVDAVRSSFEKLDRDGDGFISVQDLAQVLEADRFPRKGAAARRCSWQLAAQLVREVDLDNDGTVSYEEYRSMWVGPTQAHQQQTAGQAPVVA